MAQRESRSSLDRTEGERFDPRSSQASLTLGKTLNPELQQYENGIT